MKGRGEYATLDHPVWGEIAPELSPREFAYPHLMDVGFLRRLSRSRRLGKVPYRRVSDHRPPERNVAAGGADQSAHMEKPCPTVDLRVLSNEERYHVLLNLIAGDALLALRAVQACGHLLPAPVAAEVQRALERPGFTRIGIYPPTAAQIEAYGKGAGSIHVDSSEKRPSPRIWTQV